MQKYTRDFLHLQRVSILNTQVGPHPVVIWSNSKSGLHADAARLDAKQVRYMFFVFNVKYMKSRRLRSTNLSIYDKVETGNKPWFYHFYAYFLYTLLCLV